MKKTQKWMILPIIAGFVTALLSWDQQGNFRQPAPASFNNAVIQNENEFSMEADLTPFTGDEDRFGSPSGSNDQAPSAEDVLIQRTPGDNKHLLIMAFYSRENYSGQFVSIENGSHLV